MCLDICSIASLAHDQLCRDFQVRSNRLERKINLKVCSDERNLCLSRGNGIHISTKNRYIHLSMISLFYLSLSLPHEHTLTQTLTRIHAHTHLHTLSSLLTCWIFIWRTKTTHPVFCLVSFSVHCSELVTKQVRLSNKIIILKLKA